MAGRDHRSRTVLTSASLIRWIGRRVWRWFFMILFVAAVWLNVATVTSRSVFDEVSSLVAATGSSRDLVRDAVATELEAERRARMAAVSAEAEARAALEQAEARSRGGGAILFVTFRRRGDGGRTRLIVLRLSA